MLQISPPLAHVLPHQTSPTATTSPSVFSTLHSHSRSLSLSSVAAGLDLEPRWLIQSPYIERDHQLDLWTLDHEAALLARALATLRPTRSDYAQAPYRDGFNWDEVAEKLRELAASNGKKPSQYREMSFYIVVFRSQIPPETTYEDLGLLDKPAHAEAIASGGFLKYWFGSPDAQGRNLATCIWRSRHDAVQGSKGQWHKKAARATASLYSYWKIERIRLTVREGASGIGFAEWTD